MYTYFYEESDSALRLFESQLRRLSNANPYAAAEIPSFEDGGEWFIDEALERAGLPLIRGTREREYLRRVREASKALGVIA